MDMDLKTVHHVAIINSDLAKAREFYVEKLGFAIVNEVDRPEKDDHIMWLELNGLQLEIFIMKDPPARPTDPEALGLRHLAFRVASVEDTVKELEKLGIPCEPVRMDIYSQRKMTFFYDPDGLPLELHE
jgi:glyoxylase I family protein